MNYTTLLERHPEVALDRHSLSFSDKSAVAEIGRAYALFGAVLLEQALPPAVLSASACAFRQYLQAQAPSAATSDARGSWHSPWLVRQGDHFAMAGVLAAVVRSWIWDVVEEMCQSAQIVLLLKFCTARHNVDDTLGLGGHQDAKVVDASVPLSLWIPLQEIVPGRCSGLGFVVPRAERVLPTPSHDDVGADYLLRELGNLWLPHYALGDATIHSNLSVHFTTGFGTRTDRYSFEVRAMPRASAPAHHLDPVLYVARRNGLPTFVEAYSSIAKPADGFLRATQSALAAMPIGQKRAGS
ncbi:MAG: hypothetical protein JOY64_00700 [Alphaproteobacteria bacterium]|nr:hypothetical protein [Alphaproteobacteria bacterium]MBV8406120.1 hypothetical protein [Alphaproteobacteria bacterium]